MKLLVIAVLFHGILYIPLPILKSGGAKRRFERPSIKQSEPVILVTRHELRVSEHCVIVSQLVVGIDAALQLWLFRRKFVGIASVGITPPPPPPHGSFGCTNENQAMT